MEKLFTYHKLNAMGQRKAELVASTFDSAYETLCRTVGAELVKTREFALVRTKLQEACFFAKNLVSIQPENQE